MSRAVTEEKQGRKMSRKAGIKDRCAAVILAAGKGKRMNSGIQKQYMLLGGKPLIYYSLQAFEEGPADDIILVTGEDEREYCQNEIVDRYGFKKVKAVISGGKERYHSVYEGIKYLDSYGAYGEGDYVLIHDGARPFADKAIIARVLEGAHSYGACAAGMPSKDTVKLSDSLGFAKMTPERAMVWTIQTPQGFSYPLLKDAYNDMMKHEEYQKGITDDAMVIESMTDRKVKLTEGSYRNIKVTTPEDIYVAETLLRNMPGKPLKPL